MADEHKSGAMSALDLTTLINDYDKTIGELRGELREQKSMVKDALENDQEYHEIAEKVKELNRQKSVIKQRILKTPAVDTVMTKVRDLQAELKDMEDKLSGYLQEYQRVSGTNVIEGTDGELRQIVPVYRLVKKPKK